MSIKSANEVSLAKVVLCALSNKSTHLFSPTAFSPFRIPIPGAIPPPLQVSNLILSPHQKSLKNY